MYEWRTTTKNNGIHVIEVKSVDGAGNERIIVRSIKIENIDYSWTVMTLLIIASFVLVWIFAIIRFKKLKKEQRFLQYRSPFEPQQKQPLPPSPQQPVYPQHYPPHGQRVTR